MNFKPNTLKTTLSIILGLLIGFGYISMFHGLDYSALGISPWAKYTDSLIYSLISAIIIYIIYSLIQKK